MLQDAYALSSVTVVLMQNVTNYAHFLAVLITLEASYIESVISKLSLRDPSGPSANVAERDNSIIRIRSSFQRSSFC